jgi:hypothetical protein
VRRSSLAQKPRALPRSRQALSARDRSVFLSLVFVGHSASLGQVPERAHRWPPVLCESTPCNPGPTPISPLISGAQRLLSRTRSASAQEAGSSA